MFRVSGQYTPDKGPRVEIGVLPGFDLPAVTPEQIPRFTGLLDTGATKTCISPRVVEALQPQSIGKTTIQSAAGQSSVYIYAVGVVVFLGVDPPTILHQPVDAAVFTHSPGLDVLIGMDIISRGILIVTSDTFDFLITR